MPKRNDSSNNGPTRKGDRLFMGIGTSALAIALGFATLGVVQRPALAGSESSCPGCDGSAGSGNSQCTDHCPSCNWYWDNGSNPNDGYYRCLLQ